MKKIVILGPANSIHTQKWVNSLVDFYDIKLISFQSPIDGYDSRVSVESFNVINKYFFPFYCLTIFDIINRYKPGLVHIHYCTSYGMFSMFLKGTPMIISVWGADIIDFPEKSVFHKAYIKYVLSKATHITSTSKFMAKFVNKVGKISNVSVVPFGIDISKFKKNRLIELSDKPYILGTVKTLLPKYGIDTLIKAFFIFNKKYDVSELHIYGVGEDLDKLRDLVNELDLTSKVFFKGYIRNDDVPIILNKFDIYCALSRLDSESFGVAIIEAMACGLPVVVSNKGGLPEVVVNGKTGIVVPSDNPKAAFEAIETLYLHQDLYNDFSRNAVRHVRENYDWTVSVDLMRNIYDKYLN